MYPPVTKRAGLFFLSPQGCVASFNNSRDGVGGLCFCCASSPGCFLVAVSKGGDSFFDRPRHAELHDSVCPPSDIEKPKPGADEVILFGRVVKWGRSVSPFAAFVFQAALRTPLCSFLLLLLLLLFLLIRCVGCCRCCCLKAYWYFFVAVHPVLQRRNTGNEAGDTLLRFTRASTAYGCFALFCPPQPCLVAQFSCSKRIGRSDEPCM